MAAGGPQISWGNVIGALLASLALLTVLGALIQTQRNADLVNTENQIKATREIQQIRSEAFRETEDIRHRFVEQRENELRAELTRIKDELLPRLVTKDQFQAVEKAADERWSTQAAINNKATDAYVSSKAWDTWRPERDKWILQMQQRIEMLERRLPELDGKK